MDDIKNKTNNLIENAGNETKTILEETSDQLIDGADALKKQTEKLAGKADELVKSASSAADSVVKDITKSTTAANATVDKKGASNAILIGIGLIALILGAFYLISNLNFNNNSVDGALKNIGKLVADGKYTEASELFDMDQIIDNMVKSDSIWKSALAQQGVTSPTPEQITQIRDLVVNNEQVFTNFKKSIKQSFVDAIQGDDVADPDLLSFFQSLKDGTAVLDIKMENDEASFVVGSRKEKWFMKKFDGKWKVYKIEFNQEQMTNDSSKTSTSQEATTNETTQEASTESSTSSSTVTQ